MPESLPTARRVAYACGNPGFQVSDRIVVAMLLYYYLPPGGRDLEAQVSQEIFFGVLTAFGLAMLIGRVLDSLADPVVGWACDRSRSRWGRRRSFLMAGVLPMTALPVLGFFPPGAPGSDLNFVWLTGVVGLYFVFFTVYVGPYLALMPELARNQDDRVRLSTTMAVAAIPVQIFGFAWTAGLDWGRSFGLSGGDALRAIVVTASAVGLVLCMLPIWAVDERRHAEPAPADISFLTALSATFRNGPFLTYLGAQMLFILGLNMAAPLLPYVAAVMGRPDSFAALLGTLMFVATLAAFGLARRWTARFGPRRMLAGATGLFAVVLASLGLIRPDPTGQEHALWNTALACGSLVLMGAPVAAFIVLPNVVISQIIDADRVRTGAVRAAMYFGMQGFLTKWVYGVALALMALLFSRFGNSAEEPLGVLLVGPIAGACCAVAAVLYLRYPEQAVLDAARPPEPPAG